MSLLRRCRSAVHINRLRAAAKDPVQVLVNRAMRPIRLMRADGKKREGQLEKDRASLEALLADSSKRLEAAVGHLERHRAEESRQLGLAARLSGEKKALQAQRDAKGNEFLSRAAEVGFEHAEERLQQVRANLNSRVAHAQGRILQEYERLHFQTTAKSNEIKDAHANAARANQAAAEHQQAKDAEVAKKAEIEKRLEEVTGSLQTLQSNSSDIAQRQAQVEEDVAELRRTVLWASSLSPLIRPGVANLPVLLVQRRQAVALAVAQGKLPLLRDMMCVASELEEFPGLEPRLRAAGFAASEMRRMGFSLARMKRSGFQVQELLQAEYGPAELRGVGFSAVSLGDAGVPAEELLRIGFSAADLREAGFKADVLAGLGLSPSELKRGGFTLEDLLQAGFLAPQLKDAGFSADRLRQHGLPALRLVDMGFGRAELTEAGFDPDCVNAACWHVAGKSVDELFEEGFSAFQLKRAGFNASQMFPECSAPKAWFRYALL